MAKAETSSWLIGLVRFKIGNASEAKGRYCFVWMIVICRGSNTKGKGRMKSGREAVGGKGGGRKTGAFQGFYSGCVLLSPPPTSINGKEGCFSTLMSVECLFSQLKQPQLAHDGFSLTLNRFQVLQRNALDHSAHGKHRYDGCKHALVTFRLDSHSRQTNANAFRFYYFSACRRRPRTEPVRQALLRMERLLVGW